MMKIDGRQVRLMRTGFEMMCGLIEFQRLDVDTHIETIYLTSEEIERG
jgi:hypothetical protein